jgi:hypothetical protein
MTVAEIRDRLDDRFRLLRGSGRGGVERHQTLQATVQWSHDLLDEPDRHLFECLSVFPAGFDATAVEAICGPLLGLDDWDLRDALDRLVERSLVIADRDGDTTRYRLLETFRQFGEQRLDLDTATTLHRAHLTHFSEVASNARDGFTDRVFDPEPDPWLVDRDNIRAAMHWAIADEDHDTCERFALAWMEDYTVHHSSEFEDWAIEAASHQNARATTLAIASQLAGYGSRGDFTTGLGLAHRAAEVGSREPSPWIMLGLALFFAGGPSIEAANAFIRGSELLEPQQLTWRAIAHGMAASAASGVDPSIAATQLSRVEALLEAGLSPRGREVARGVLARAVLAAGDLDRAIALCDETLAATTDPRSRARLGAYGMRAEALALKSDPEAAPAFVAAIEQYAELGWWGQIWRILVPLAQWWTTIDNRSAAAHIVGHATANNIGVAGLDQLDDALSDSSVLTARRQGAQMTRTELLDHIIAELDPVASRGVVERWTEA